MSAIKGLVDRTRLAFNRLTQQEQMFVVVGSLAGLFFLLLIVALTVSSATHKIEKRTRINKAKLEELVRLQGEYKWRKQASERKIRAFKRKSKVLLVKSVEDAAKKSGVDLRDIKPSKGKANEDGVRESRVRLKASKLSADRLEDFLKRLDQLGDETVLRELKVTRPRRKDTLNVELTLTTYRIEG
ncbi:MAG TPA: hypothetical protein EYN91_13730 [Candidatus Melainabacteria bacterium]|nr:hypothetical protein [Candidatus Melainabacteria bacterium]